MASRERERPEFRVNERYHYAHIAISCAWYSALSLAARAVPPAPQEIAKLVVQLGADDFAAREAAQKKLETIGEPALEALRKAAANGDVEVKSRALKLIQTITAKTLGADAAKLQGVWRLFYVGETGKGMNVGNDGFEIAFRGKQYAWKGSGFLSFVDTSGQFTLGEERGNKTLDLQSSQQATRLAVYDVENDVLKICMDMTQEKHRPQRLEPRNSPQLVLLTFFREKP